MPAVWYSDNKRRVAVYTPELVARALMKSEINWAATLAAITFFIGFGFVLLRYTDRVVAHAKRQPGSRILPWSLLDAFAESSLYEPTVKLMGCLAVLVGILLACGLLLTLMS